MKMDKQNIEKLPQKGENSVLRSGMTDKESIRVLDELCYKLIE